MRKGIDKTTQDNIESQTTERRFETFEKCPILVKIKAREDFNHRNILNISRIKIRTQRRNWAKGGVFQKSRFALPKQVIIYRLGENIISLQIGQFTYQ